MPRIATHYFFGQRIIKHNEDLKKCSEAAKKAYFLGNLGPDAFFCKKVLRECAYDLHQRRINAPIYYMNEYAIKQSEDKRQILEAYIKGYINHFILDSVAHPFVFSLQRREKEKAGLSDRYDIYLHRRIESVIDIVMSREELGLGAVDFKPHRTIPSDQNVFNELDAMLQYALERTFKIKLKKNDITACFKIFRFLSIIAYSPAGIKKSIVRVIEWLFRRPYDLSASFFTLFEDENEDYMNYSKSEWENPFDKSKKSNQSFLEIFEAAEKKAAAVLNKYDNEKNEENFKAINLTEGISYETGLKADEQDI